jgi:tRNA (guanine-N(7)-)-methyltransferase
MTLETLLNYKNFYGRRTGKRLSKTLRSSLDTVLPTICFTVGEEDINPANLFDKPYTKYALEIGFGQGDNLLNQAINNPDTGYLGVDLFMNGLANITHQTAKKNLPNIRLGGLDGRVVLEKMAPASLHQIFVLFSDPWPKNKQHKRRMITADFIKLAATKLVPNGQLILASDHPDYKLWIAKEIEKQSVLKTIKIYDTAIERPAFIEMTKYEIRGLRLGDTALYFVLDKN